MLHHLPVMSMNSTAYKGNTSPPSCVPGSKRTWANAPPAEPPGEEGTPGVVAPGGPRRLVEGLEPAGCCTPSFGAVAFSCLAQLSPPSRHCFCPRAAAH